MVKKVEFREYKKFPKVERSEIFKEEDLIGEWQKRFEEMEKVVEESKKNMADITREEAIVVLSQHKQRYMNDFGWDTTTLNVLEMAISDMKRVAQLEEEEGNDSTGSH